MTKAINVILLAEYAPTSISNPPRRQRIPHRRHGGDGAEGGQVEETIDDGGEGPGADTRGGDDKGPDGEHDLEDNHGGDGGEGDHK